MTVPVSDLQAVAPSAIIELFELTLNVDQHGVAETYRFHAGTSLNANGELAWNGNSYMRYPVEADGFEYNGNGQLPRPKLRVSNILGTITALMQSLPSGIEGAEVIRIRTLARYLDAVNFPGNTNPYGAPDPTAEFPREVFYIDRKSIETRDVIEFELAAAFDLAGVRVPKRQCLANVCQWKYRSAECGYTDAAYFDKNDNPVSSAAQDVCGKRLSSCEVRFSSFTRTGAVTSGSPLLTVTQPLSVAAGTPVYGHALQAGTTVSSASSNGLIVTLSANAVANMSETRTGTIQSNRTTINVSSAAGLVVGMSVSGAYVRAGTTISGIVGNAITLSQPTDEYVTLVATRTGTCTRGALYITDGLTYSAGLYVMGAGFAPSTYTPVTSISSSMFALPGFRYAYLVTANPSPSQTVTVGNYPQYVFSSYSFYSVNNYASSTYTFTGSPSYTFRNPATAGLPYGGFPGIGVFGS